MTKSMSTTNLNRRALLKSAGAITLTFLIASDDATSQTPAAKPKLPGSLDSNRFLRAWLRVNPDSTVTLMIGKVELGQGILTAVAQVGADELEIDIDKLVIISGDTSLVPNEGVTAGSFSMPNCATAVRYAAAEVRGMLLDLAAAKLGKPLETLTAAKGVITSSAGGSLSYGDLASGLTLDREATGAGKLKPAADYRYVGKNIPRLDIPAKMTGAPSFIQDLRPAGMLYGQIVRPPTYKAKLKSIDLAAIEKLPGVFKAVRDGSFLGVMAAREEQANDAAIAMAKAAEWDIEKGALPTTAGIFDWLQKAKAQDIEIKNVARAAPGTAAKTLEATYLRPCHMHGSIGPSTGIATLGADGTMTVQTHSQSVFETQVAIAKMLGMEPAKVRLQHVQGAGCYGHNLADDAAADAALLARAVPGKIVRLQYTRETEHRWEPYGSAMVIKTKAAVDANGDILDWALDLWSMPHGTRPQNEPGNLLSARYLEKPFTQPVPVNIGPPNYGADRNAIALYEFPGHRVTTHFVTEMPVRVSSTRGLGAYANVVAIESFMDELALNAGVDPVAYRMRTLKDPRARDVLTAAAEKFGWASWQKRPGFGRGIAFAKYKNIATYCAVALEVQVDRASGLVKVVRAVSSADAGHIVSPDGVINQIEGGLIQGLSWSLKEEVAFDDTRVLSEDWASYPILTFSEVPPVDVVLVDRPGAPFLGAGEASQGPAGAALANAFADATGTRLRQIPFTPDRVKAALAKT
jgi:nicotinate dehydrogenase subunit B